MSGSGSGGSRKRNPTSSRSRRAPHKALRTRHAGAVAHDSATAEASPKSVNTEEDAMASSPTRTAPPPLPITTTAMATAAPATGSSTPAPSPPPPQPVVDVSGSLHLAQAGTDVSKRDLVRLLLSSLGELGLSSTVSALQSETGVEAEPESPILRSLWAAIQSGEWEDALTAIDRLSLLHTTSGSSTASVDVPTAHCHLLVLRQQFLELVEAGSAWEAVSLLRGRIAAPARVLYRTVRRAGPFADTDDGDSMAPPPPPPPPLPFPVCSFPSAPDLSDLAARRRRSRGQRRLRDGRPAHLTPVCSERLALEVELAWTPSHLHTLAACTTATSSSELMDRVGWPGGESSRKQLFDVVQTHLAPSSVPHGRLASLLSQSLQFQTVHCAHHGRLPAHVANTPSPSILSDHVCTVDSLPTQCVAVLTGVGDEVWGVAFSHDGSRLACTSCNGTVVVWNVGAAVKPDPAAAIGDVGSEDGAGLLWDVPKLHELDTEGPALNDLAWSLDDSVLAVCGDDGFLQCWSTTPDMALRHTLVHHHGDVTSVAWVGPDRLVSGGADGDVVLWDTASGDVVRAWKLEHVRQVAVSPAVPDVVFVLSGGYSLTRLAVYDTTRPPSVELQVKSPAGCIVTSADGRSTVVQLPRLNALQVCDTSTGAAVQDLTPDRRRLAAAGGGDDDDGDDENEDEDDGHLYEKQEHERAFVTMPTFVGVKDGFVAGSFDDCAVWLWHAATSRPMASLLGHAARVNAVASTSASATAHTLLASASDDQTIRLWAPPVVE